jgi:catechol 2,3-dioxygenase-like lactoylglutathione lyase family enzyme
VSATNFDRGMEDVGNIVALEHVNVTMPDQRLATLFYVVGMGFTRDPYLSVGDENMWINLGRQQFHLPTRSPQVLRGHVGIVVPDLAALVARLSGVRDKLAGTRFGYAEQNGCVTVICPWGNELRCYAPGPNFGDMTLGMPYVEFSVGRGAVSGIVQFYEQAFGVKGTLTPDRSVATIPTGRDQCLVFREGDALAPYDGHHIAIYVADFAGPHRYLKARDLVTEESDQHQYRFRQIADPDSGARLFEIEHEVRSLKHPMWGRAFVNRNPAQSQRNYLRGRDAFYG